MNCLVCEIETSNSKYCSLSCQMKHRNILSRIENIQKYLLNPTKCKKCFTTLSYDDKNKQFCSRSCSAMYNNATRILSDKALFNIRNGNKKYHELNQNKKRNKNIENYNLKPNKCSICNNKLEYNKRNHKTCSKHCYIKLISTNAINNPNVGGYKSEKQLRRYQSIYKGYKLDSGGEKYLVSELDKLGIKWIKNDASWGKFYFFINLEGKKRKYYPDFYLPQCDIWVEMKGKRYMRPDDNLRRAAVPDNRIKLVMNNEVKDFINQVEELLK